MHAFLIRRNDKIIGIVSESKTRAEALLKKLIKSHYKSYEHQYTFEQYTDAFFWIITKVEIL